MDPIEHLLQFFVYSVYSSEGIQKVSKLCSDLARTMADELSKNPETTVGLRKLFEAKDAFVRSALLREGE